jgi:hypothetical protein
LEGRLRFFEMALVRVQQLAHHAKRFAKRGLIGISRNAEDLVRLLEWAHGTANRLSLRL